VYILLTESRRQVYWLNWKAKLYRYVHSTTVVWKSVGQLDARLQICVQYIFLPIIYIYVIYSCKTYERDKLRNEYLNNRRIVSEIRFCSDAVTARCGLRSDVRRNIRNSFSATRRTNRTSTNNKRYVPINSKQTFSAAI